MKVKDMTLTAVMAALVCIAGPLTVPAGPIPLSLATFAVYLAGAVLGKKRGTLSVALYLLIGIIGVPVFSGFSGGFQKLAGVTGGYLAGYLPCAFLSGLGGDGCAVCGRHGLVHGPVRERPRHGAVPVRGSVPAGRRGEDRGGGHADGPREESGVFHSQFMMKSREEDALSIQGEPVKQK